MSASSCRRTSRPPRSTAGPASAGSGRSAWTTRRSGSSCTGAAGRAGSTGSKTIWRRGEEAGRESRPEHRALVRRCAGGGVRRLHRPGCPAGVVPGPARLDRRSRVRPARGGPLDGGLRAAGKRAVSGDERVHASRPTLAPRLHVDGHDAGRVELRHGHGGHLRGAEREDPDDHRPHRLPQRRAPRRSPGRLAWLPGPAGAGRQREGRRLNAVLRPSSVELLWITDIYGFLLAGSLITMGTLGDRIGRRRLLLIGSGAFGVCSVLAAYASNPEQLIAARALLGVAGATLAPSTLSLIRSMFVDARQRTLAIGVWIASFSAGAAIGPLAGGVLLERSWWGSVFLLAVPVMALRLVVGPLLLPEYRDDGAGRLDLRSAAMSLAAVLLVIWGLKQLAQDGLGLPPALSIVAGLAVGVAFVRRQQLLADPLLDLRLFRSPAFSAALAANTLDFFVAFAAFLFISQYLQLVLGLSPLEAGLWMLPSSAG